MFQQDQIVILDYETVELQEDGSKQASTEFYRKEFRVDSVAISWRDGDDIRSKFVQGEDAARELLTGLQPVRLVCHNAQFEIGVSRCRFPDLKFQWYADTQRLAQQWDNGGDENSYEMILIEPETPDDEPDAKKMPLSGFSLVKCAKRILDLPDHKLEAYTWLRNNGVKKGQEGANLHRLPMDVYERYNVGDTETTLKLYEFFEEKFLEMDFNWQFDHGLYLSTVGYVADAKIRGVHVDRVRLATYAQQVNAEVAQISEAFKERFAAEIRQVERHRLLTAVRTKKTFRGRKNYVRRAKAKPEVWAKDVAFNTGSNKQLQYLFVDILKIEPKFFTAKGSPAFKSVMLGQWGEGGLLLGKRRKRQLVFNQCKALLALSDHTGRWHLSLKMVATSSGRMAGGN